MYVKRSTVRYCPKGTVHLNRKAYFEMVNITQYYEMTQTDTTLHTNRQKNVFLDGFFGFFLLQLPF